MHDFPNCFVVSLVQSGFCAGSGAFVKVLGDWRANGAFDGLDLTQ